MSQSIPTMHRIIPGIALSLWIAGCATAAESASPPPSASYRYLFLLDASKGMSVQRETAIDTIYNLLANGINHRAQAGDLVGLWTFNDQLNTNGFPPHLWNPRQPVDIANYAFRYLDELKFSDRANLDTAMQALLEVTKKSDRLIVFLVSSGRESIHGTPFDVRVNAVFDAHGAKMRDSRKPFITVFVVEDGEMVNHAISPAGDTVYIPPLPPEEPPVQPEATAETAAPAPPATPDPVSPAPAPPVTTTQAVPETNPPVVKSVQQIQKEILRSQSQMARERAAEQAAATAAAKTTNIPAATASSSTTSNQVTAATEATLAPAQTPEPPVIPPPSAPLVETTPEPTPVAASRTSAAAESPTPELPSAPSPKPTTPPVVPVPVLDDTPSSWPHLLRGAGLILAAIALSWILLRNMRQRQGPSIITRSFEHHDDGRDPQKGDTQVYR